MSLTTTRSFPALSRNWSLLFLAAALWAPASATARPAGLPPPPAPMNLPQPGPETEEPYAPMPIVSGGVVVPLYPPDSPHLNQARIREAEKYHSYSPPFLGYITNIHNPSIEFHPGNGSLNTGACIILAGGGAHERLGVVGEGADFVHFFASYGISTAILRNRLRSDGYDPKTDGVNDALQAIKLARAYASDWGLDPNKIGFMGFSAGAELAAAASLFYADFDAKNDIPGNPLANVSSRPDFVGLIYPGPSPFAFGGSAEIPRDAPPAFFASGGWGDWIHAVWANDYFVALTNDAVPNVEMHIYARGVHPGDPTGPDGPPGTGGLTDRAGTAFGKWHFRYLDWFRDLGFMGKPGVETIAARDVARNLDRPDRMAMLKARVEERRKAEAAKSDDDE